MRALEETFTRCRGERRAAFIAYLTAGDPDLSRTGDLVRALVAGGADVIELGVPFSDPIADGPVNQRAATRALASGTNLSGILELVARERDRWGAPVVLFTYFNPIHARGCQRFAEQAASSGVDGVLCVDLPPEEGKASLTSELEAHGVDSIYLLAPTSTKQRIRAARDAASGFLYYVSLTGVTGERARLSEGLEAAVRTLRRRIDLPLAVGFGISDPAQVEAVGKVADGVVVGSTLVRIVEEDGASPDLPANLEERVRWLSAPLHSRGGS